jgi:hypothetical protein
MAGGVGPLAHADEASVARRVQVRRVAADLQLAGGPRPGRVAQVKRVERVGLPERHDMARGPGETHRVDALTAPQTADPARLDQARPPRRARTYTALSVGGGEPATGGASWPEVVAIRRFPAYSDRAYWFSGVPGTDASNRGGPEPLRPKR